MCYIRRPYVSVFSTISFNSGSLGPIISIPCARTRTFPHSCDTLGQCIPHTPHTNCQPNKCDSFQVTKTCTQLRFSGEYTSSTKYCVSLRYAGRFFHLAVELIATKMYHELWHSKGNIILPIIESMVS